MIDGYVHPEFSQVSMTLTRQLEKAIGGAAVAVYHRGKCVVDIWGGHRNAEGAPWEEGTLAQSFSTTKGVASTVVHILADRGLLDYDEPVCSYWPEFAQAGKERITLREVMAHQSGLYHVRQMVDHAERMLDWDYMIKAIEKSPPAHEPGTRMGYHGLTYGYLVGEIIERVTGEKLARVIEKELVKPLKLDGVYIGATDLALLRTAQLIGPQGGRRTGLEIGQSLRAPAMWLQGVLDRIGVDIEFASALDVMPRGISAIDFSSEELLRTSSPSINGLFTARSLARVYAMLAGRGELEGQRLISRQCFDRATEIQHPPTGGSWIPFDLNWRLGWHRIGTSRGLLPEAFGHFGFGGSGAWADPSRELSVAMIVNSGGAPMDTRILKMGAAVVKAADERD